MTVPEQAAQSASESDGHFVQAFGGRRISPRQLRNALEAAEPHIRRDERENIRQLAFNESATYYAIDPATGLSVLRDFADLIGGTP